MSGKIGLDPGLLVVGGGHRAKVERSQLGVVQGDRLERLRINETLSFLVDQQGVRPEEVSDGKGSLEATGVEVEWDRADPECSDVAAVDGGQGRPFL